MAAFRGCLVRTGCLVLLVGGVAAGWSFRDDISSWWRARAPAEAPEDGAADGDVAEAGGGARDVTETAPGNGDAPERDATDGGDATGGGEPAGTDGAEVRPGPSPEAAARAELRLQRFFAADPPAELRLEGVELESLLRFRVAPGLPEGVADPGISVGDSVVELSAAVDLRKLAGARIPPMVRRMVGDSSRISTRLRPTVERPGRLRLQVLEARAGAVRIPPLLLPWILGEFGLSPAPDQPGAVELELGPGVTALELEDGGVWMARGEAGAGG